MKQETQIDKVSFIIDTNLYSGNFDRQMCAFVTGQIGECSVGKEYIEDAEDLQDEFPSMDVPRIMEWMEENILQVMDEDGICRPCTIETTPGRTNNGYGKHSDIAENNPLKYPAYESVAIYFGEEPPAEVLSFMMARAPKFVRRSLCNGDTASKPEITGFRMEATYVPAVQQTPINVALV